ncbi:MAG: DUF6288 domain-containing protein [Planctomycetota bacterium]|nr:DUF6288 domain-containing protein [Planctomycetota bacterium]
MERRTGLTTGRWVPPARGWICGWQGHTSDARQILITDVAKGSPVAGILEKGDVILGVDGKPFDDDARIRFARAVTEAEKASGVLRLIRWRQGRSENVQMKLARMVKTLRRNASPVPNCH